MPFPFLYLDTSFYFLSGIVAFLVSFYAFRYTRLIENSALRFLSIGFTVLGVGLLAEAFIDTLSFFIPSTSSYLLLHRLIIREAAATYSFLQVLAYFVILMGYLLSRRGPASAASSNGSMNRPPTIGFLASATSVVLASRLGELGVLIALAREIIIISSALSMAFLVAIIYLDSTGYLKHRNKQAILVLVGFVLILASQAISFSLGIVATRALGFSEILDFIGTAVQFAAFLSLLLFLIWRGKIGSTGKSAQ